VPVDLAKLMQLKTPFPALGEAVSLIPINPFRPQVVGEGLFPARRAFPLRLLVHVPKALRSNPDAVAVRQLYEGQELGRVTFRMVQRSA
jgi:serine protease